jgi:glycogen debranching enzyme
MDLQAATASEAEPTPGVYIAANASLAMLRPRTLKHGDTFALFDQFGDIRAGQGRPDGLYHNDTRFLSKLRLTIDGQPPLLLSSTVQSNNAVLDVDVTNSDLIRGDAIVTPKDTFHLARMKFLWDASCYEMLAIRNFDERPRQVRVALEFDADFVDLFEVRGFTRTKRGSIDARIVAPDHVRFDYRSLDGLARATQLLFEPAPSKLNTHSAEFELTLQPGERRAIAVTVHCTIDGQQHERRFRLAMRRARRSLRESVMRAAAIETSNTVANEVLCRSMADLNMLVTDTEHGPYPYAGVPWYSTAFGRDGLITALQILWVYPSLARGVLKYLAAHQATHEDPLHDAEPGKILHETRECELARLGEVPFGRYYGSIDSTPLYVVLAGLYWQYTADRSTLESIWPNIKAALAWIDRYGDSDRDGFVEYRRRSDGGLANQGWKDSSDSVFHEDGRLAEPSIALCEVQGYVYMARQLGAQIARALGEHALASQLEGQAQELREKFEATFWDDALGTYVLALDGEKRPCRVRTSNAGQVLFSRIADPARAARVVSSLMSREFFTGWGIRTVGMRERRFNPTSYHNGSIWPHDNALIALGFAAYGFSAEVNTLTTALFDAAAHMDLRRLPELFCGTRRRRDKGPVLYPIACSPQAWAAATPFALLQACLGLEIDAGQRIVRLRHPRLPEFLDWVRVSNLRVGQNASVDLLLRRHKGDVAVNVLKRSGGAAVVVRL